MPLSARATLYREEAQRRLCPQPKEFYREGAQGGMAATKKYYREDAKVAKLREPERSCLILENLVEKTRKCRISTKDAKLREAKINSCDLPHEWWARRVRQFRLASNASGLL
jgi:hypothetical protein